MTLLPAPPPALISLSSFGADAVRREGQRHYVELAADAGADGVEVRGELLLDGTAELAAIGACARDRGLALVYSSPEGLWDAAQRFDADALERGLRAAHALGARRLKMSIGGFAPGQAAGLAALSRAVAGQPIGLVIENDQTASAGTLPALQAFLDEARQLGLDLGLTFDMGNWHWTGEDPLAAASALEAQVAYVHCKGVQRQPQRWVAVPMAESAAPWRAVLRRLPADAPRAIEYPLQGDDLVGVVRQQLALLRETEVAR